MLESDFLASQQAICYGVNCLHLLYNSSVWNIRNAETNKESKKSSMHFSMCDIFCIVDTRPFNNIQCHTTSTAIFHRSRTIHPKNKILFVLFNSEDLRFYVCWEPPSHIMSNI